MRTKYLGTVLGLALLTGTVNFAQASSLTQTQINSIVALLQSFGADSGTIASVAATLGGATSPSQCSSFANLHYGQFDSVPGGPVSQLQDFLGIPSTTFGYGTYGPKTQVLWLEKCGSQSTNLNSANFTARQTAGNASLTVTFSALNVWQPVVDSVATIVFGDGTSGTLGMNTQTTCTGSGAAIAGACTYTASHIYAAVGTYTATLEDSSGNVLGTQTINVTGNQVANIPVISQVTPQPVSVGSSLTVYFANGMQNGSVILKTLDGSKEWSVPYYTSGETAYNGFIFYDGTKVTFTVPSTIGRGQLPENSGYEAPVPITSGTYDLSVYATECPQSGACTSSGGASNVVPITIASSNSTQPTATIDQNGETITTSSVGGSFSITGTAQNSAAAIVTLISADNNDNAYSAAADWNTIGGYLKGSTYAMTPAGNRLYSYTSAVTGNHQFTVNFNNVPVGLYTVLVHNSDYAQYALMAQGTVNIATGGGKG